MGEIGRGRLGGPGLPTARRTAWDLHSATSAKRAPERLARSLEGDHPGAAVSFREGLDETLTVLRLGLTGRCSGRCARRTSSRTSTAGWSVTRAT